MEFRGVCYRRTASNWEPLTCAKDLTGSRYVRGRLNTLAPNSGSRYVWSAESRSRRQAGRDPPPVNLSAGPFAIGCLGPMYIGLPC
jgi:hypothetical protein